MLFNIYAVITLNIQHYVVLLPINNSARVELMLRVINAITIEEKQKETHFFY